MRAPLPPRVSRYTGLLASARFPPVPAWVMPALVLLPALVLAWLWVWVLLSWLGELLGLISRTFRFTDTSMVIESSVTNLSGGARNALLAFYVVALIGAAAGMAFQNRKTERIVRERLHLQAWQLRQLVA